MVIVSHVWGQILLDDSHSSVVPSRAFVPTQAMHFALRTERQTIARGWARFIAATATSSASAAFAKEAQKMAMIEAYVVDLQQKVPQRSHPRKTLPNHGILCLSTRVLPKNRASPIVRKATSIKKRGVLFFLFLFLDRAALGLISTSCRLRISFFNLTCFNLSLSILHRVGSRKFK